MTAMTAQAEGSRITADEFLSGHYPTGSELVDGLVYVMDPAFDHQEVAARLLMALRMWAAGHGLGRVGFGGNWVLSDGHVYKPDVWWTSHPPRGTVSVWDPSRTPRGTRHDGPPELAVEVRSPGTWAIDVGLKLRRYESSGTAELWLVDPPARSVLVFRRDDSGPGFAGAVDLGAGEALTTALLPGFTLPVDELFADLG